MELGLRVNKLGKSSVVYEVGVFKEGTEAVSAVGGYTHVFVHNTSRKSAAIDSDARVGLEKLLVAPPVDAKL